MTILDVEHLYCSSPFRCRFLSQPDEYVRQSTISLLQPGRSATIAAYTRAPSRAEAARPAAWPLRHAGPQPAPGAAFHREGGYRRARASERARPGSLIAAPHISPRIRATQAAGRAAPDMLLFWPQQAIAWADEVAYRGLPELPRCLAPA